MSIESFAKNEFEEVPVEGLIFTPQEEEEEMTQEQIRNLEMLQFMQEMGAILNDEVI